MVRPTKSKDDIRVLDGQGGLTASEGIQTPQASSGSQTTSTQKAKVEVDIGLDVSSSVVGVCVVNRATGSLIKIYPVKLTSSKFEDIWDKAHYFENDFKSNLDPTWDIKRVFVEDVAKRFSPGFSSADTIVTLAKMNALACMAVLNATKVKPTFINVRSARAQLGIKIDTKDKTKSTKDKVFEKVLALNPTFPWLQHVAKTGKNVGQLVYDTCNQDMGDAWVAVRGGQRLHP